MPRAFRSAAPALWRRLVAALLAALVLVASAEPLLAEAHDGDAPRADVPAAAYLAHATTSDAAAGTSLVAAPAPARHAPAERTTHHAVHVCHCAHAHGGLFVPEPFVITTRVRRTAPRVAARSDRLPPSPRPEPRLRPPLLPLGA